MPEFFPRRGDGLAVFLNAGDPPLDVLPELVTMLDESGVDCLELAVPFPDSVTDGPVVRRSADRALAAGVGLEETLAAVAAVRPGLARLRIALLADWSHSIRDTGLAPVTRRIAASGADGLLVHGLPPRLRPAYYEAAAEAGLPIVTTCYHGVSSPEVLAEAAAHATAYVYLVAAYGRSGTGPRTGYAGLAPTVAALRQATSAPVAVGFGVRTREDVSAVHACGADAAIVGSAVVSRVESALAGGQDVVAAVAGLISSLNPSEAVTRRRQK
ncbi:tryptophan synthase subunit alpha [Nonomuraea sp. B12E4]|uniref:tryptophan synthase subunit alpha n=1 Tax=Nonomuraea sp. B12E4 TaxID=3153564 RepID=UPI00325CC5CD